MKVSQLKDQLSWMMASRKIYDYVLFPKESKLFIRYTPALGYPVCFILTDLELDEWEKETCGSCSYNHPCDCEYNDCCPTATEHDTPYTEFLSWLKDGLAQWEKENGN